jgi:hypothetical protein
MIRRPRRNHTPAFKAKVALAAIRGDSRLCRAPPLSPADSIHKWMSLIAPAAELAGAPGGEDYLTWLEQASIGMSLENLLTFPYVAASGRAGTTAARRLLRRRDRPVVRGNIRLGRLAGLRIICL